jgi:hypothetical protein
MDGVLDDSQKLRDTKDIWTLCTPAAKPFHSPAHYIPPSARKATEEYDSDWADKHAFRKSRSRGLSVKLRAKRRIGAQTTRKQDARNNK